MDFVKARAYRAAGSWMLASRRCLKVESEILCEGEALADAAHVFRSPRPACLEKRGGRSPPSPQPNLVARQVECSQKPRPAGETGRGLGVRSLSRIKCAGARTIVQAD